MFFNSDLLTKRGALAQVWMASHLTSKLSKQALTSTSIPKSVQSILGQDLLPMALRLSGQLLLGIARIYSRKTKYLLDDAQETLVKVKKAFQNEGRAAVDLPDDGGAGAGIDADGARGGRDINLRREGGDLEDMLALEFADGDWNLEKHLAQAAANKEKADKGKGKQKALTANIADITLDESFTHDYDFSGIDGGLGLGGDDLDLGLDLELEFDPDFALFEGDEELNALANAAEAGPSGLTSAQKKRASKKRARADGDEGSERDDDDESVELGRDAAHHASSERGLSAGPFDLDLGPEGKDANGDEMMLGEDYGGGFEQNDLGLDLGLDFNNDFGGGFDDPLGEREKTPTAPSLAGDAESSLQLTPRAAAEVAACAAAEEKKKQKENAGEPARKRQKALAVDKVIELDWEAGRLEGKERFKDPEFLPASRLHLALLNSSTSALLPRPLPKTCKTAPSLELFAPPGLLAPELQDLFKMPTRRELIKLEGRERNKDAERDVELGRRAMSVVSNLSRPGAGAGAGGLDGFGAGDVSGEFDLPLGAGDDYGGGFEQNFDFDLGLDGVEGGNVVEDGGDLFKTPTKRTSKKAKTSHAGEREGSIFSELGGRGATPAASVLSALQKDDLPEYKSEGPLAIFDDISSSAGGVASSVAGTSTPSRSQSQQQTASQSLGTTQEGEAAETETQKSGSISLRSRNTRKAVRVLKGELLEGEPEKVEEKKLEFGKVAEKASRRAAASFFFELLVLSSANVVKVQQPVAYGEIEVRATEKLVEIAV